MNPFGLTDADLLPVVSALAGAPVIRFLVEERYAVSGYYGACGEKGVPTFVYETQDGARGEATAFVKRFTWAGKSEAAIYRHLAGHGVPVPRLYGSFVDAEDCEILFLERLPRIGFDSRSEPEWLDGPEGRRERFCRHYLAEYAAAGGGSVSFERFRAETRLLSWAHKVAALDWLAARSEAARRVPEVLAFLNGEATGRQ